jgi:hypothetical protein
VQRQARVRSDFAANRKTLETYTSVPPWLAGHDVKKQALAVQRRLKLQDAYGASELYPDGSGAGAACVCPLALVRACACRCVGVSVFGSRSRSRSVSVSAR